MAFLATWHPQAEGDPPIGKLNLQTIQFSGGRARQVTKNEPLLAILIQPCSELREVLVFPRTRRLFGMFIASRLPGNSSYSRFIILKFVLFFLISSVIAFPHAIRWVRYRDPVARARVKKILDLSTLAPLPLDSRLFEAPFFPHKPCGVTLIMPVFGNLPLVQEALARVEAHTEIPWRMVLVNDASPDTQTSSFLRNWASRHGAHLIENERNLGFVSSVNLGLKQAMLWPDPVVLLNSDAFLPEAWASRLLRPLLEDPKIASVTPLSNDAELGSVPSPGRAAFVTFDEAQALDRFAQKLNGRAQVVAPTSVGFCMAMSRTALARFIHPNRWGQVACA